MRALMLLVVIALMPLPAAADDIAATSNIDAVAVFPRGAVVERIAKTTIAAGSHTVVVADLPAEARQSSIRVRGKANGGLEIGAVDSRRVSVPSTDAATTASERRRMEDEIQRLSDERARIAADGQAGEAQRTFINNLLQLPNRPGPAPATGAPREDWGQILALIGREMAPAGKAVLDAGVRMREVDRKIKDARGRLAALAPRVERRTEVRISVLARAPVEAVLTVSYQVSQAGWRPHYDARLASGTKDKAPLLTVSRRATITQRTSEAWDKVALSLSTARPSGRSAAPELRPLTVDFPSAQPPPRPVAAPMARQMNGGLRAAKPDVSKAKTEADEAPESSMHDALATGAQVTAGAFQANYAIGGRQTVPNTGQAKSVLIDESDFKDIVLTARAAPRQDPRAYLNAKFKVPLVTPWLPGQVSLFRDASFIGTGVLPQLAPGQSHDLGFGADDAVRVEARSTEVSRGETGIISQSKTDLRNWKLVIKNLHPRPISFEIQDQVPVSNNQEIKVELLARPAPTRRNVEDRRGVLAWDDKLAAGEEKTIEFGYRLSWPAAKSIVYGR